MGSDFQAEVQAALRSVGVYAHYRGHHYFLRAVTLVAEEPERLQNVCKEIYLPIAMEWKTSPGNVEKDIRTIRDVMMRNGGDKLLAELTGRPFWRDKSPYPKEIIEIFAGYFKKK